MCKSGYTIKVKLSFTTAVKTANVGGNSPKLIFKYGREKHILQQ